MRKDVYNQLENEKIELKKEINELKKQINQIQGKIYLIEKEQLDIVMENQPKLFQGGDILAEYTTNEIAAIAKVSTRQVRRIAQRERWAERKEIKGAISVSYYDKKQVDKHFGINQKTTLTTKERIEKKVIRYG